jgi:HAMP domain-containing protein
MTGEGGFDEFVQKAVTHEVSAIPHNQHPSLDIFLDAWGGELAKDVQSSFTAHLATCPVCRDRWRTLKKTLKSEQQMLEVKARVPSLNELVRQRRGVRGARVREWIRSLWPAQSLRPALAAAVVSVAITLAVVIPLLQGPVVATSERLAVLTHEVETLQGQVGLLAQGGITIPANIAPTSEITLDDLSQLASNVREITDPWQRSLIIAAFLSSHGITAPRDLDWFNLSSYTIQPDDTWQTIALRKFGNPNLWPLIWVLNAEKDFPNEALPAGAKILLPSSLE